MRATGASSEFSRGSSRTSSRTDHSTTRTTCWARSTSWSRACTAGFDSMRKHKPTELFERFSNPFTTILGHLTGRMLMRRAGYEVDIDAILSACAEHGVAIEINANPHRLDLDWRWHRRALELGCMFSINPDEHSIDELDLTRWGVLMARKGGIPPERVLNSLDLKRITAFLDSRRISRTHDLRRRIREDVSFSS